MTQMNISMKQKQTHRHREQTCGGQRGRGAGKGWSGDLGLADANYYIQIGYDFPGIAVLKSPHSHCMVCRFDPWRN